jgi:hypothetical protein
MTSVPFHDLQSLQEAVRRGIPLEFLFFWGHTAKHEHGPLGKECLSQWFGAPFTLDGRRFPTAEHYMMFQKALLFGDQQTADKILAAPNPGAAKALGRAVRGFVQATWDEHRSRIVVAGNEAKFGQNPDLRAFLLGTKKKVLVEASPSDRVWGIGLAEDDTRAANPLAWRGLNLLGFALMTARARLSEAAS